MRFHRGGLSGLFDALSELLLERAANERLDRKRIKRKDKLERKAKEREGTASVPALPAALAPQDIPHWATQPTTTQPAGAPPPTPQEAVHEVVKELQKADAEFGAMVEEMTGALGGKLPGQPDPNHENKPHGFQAPGLPGGPTPFQFVIPKAAAGPVTRVPDAPKTEPGFLPADPLPVTKPPGWWNLDTHGPFPPPGWILREPPAEAQPANEAPANDTPDQPQANKEADPILEHAVEHG